MSALISVKNMHKQYGKQTVLNNVNLEVAAGKIVGLIGPNGAGKTTALKCLLGLAPCDGELSVMGLNPRTHRAELMESICFIADTAILPRWLKVKNAVDFLEGVHPKFSREKAELFLSKTTIDPEKTVAKLSKGMITQLHLALVMAIDVRLLILDEPTLGLDILFRKQFYNSLLNDYFDQERTIVITTHQVEEIEALLTDLMFIKQGGIVLDQSMEKVTDTYVELEVSQGQIEKAKALNPISEQSVLGSTKFLFEGVSREALSELGDIRVPGVADIFFAKMQ